MSSMSWLDEVDEEDFIMHLLEEEQLAKEYREITAPGSNHPDAHLYTRFAEVFYPVEGYVAINHAWKDVAFEDTYDIIINDPNEERGYLQKILINDADKKVSYGYAASLEYPNVTFTKFDEWNRIVGKWKNGESLI